MDGGLRRVLARGVAATGVGRLLAATIGLLLALAVVGVGLALIANGQLRAERRLVVDQVEPALRAALALENALVNEETGVRGYALTGEPRFLEPYHSGREGEVRAYAQLHAHERAIGGEVATEVERIRVSAQTWRQEYVAHALVHRRSARGSIGLDVHGKRLFDQLRSTLTRVRIALTARESQTRGQLERAGDDLQFLLVLAAALIVGGIVGAGLLLRWTITRPLARLGAETRRVGAGEFARPLGPIGGAREITEVGAEVDTMRARIAYELATVEEARRALEQQAVELQRSNAELEQFAYVASHDLQEPLRKVASFCQALRTRYHGQLDERADEYIDFAVDGAKRMQTLINDLLVFSRVGRGERGQEPVALAAALADARSALADQLTDAGASVAADGLPTVRGDRALLTSLFQNLLSNAVKFRGEGAPVVTVSARRAETEWELSVADNGIGVDPEYAERIFLIFQRLHPRAAYEGSGIGLALCRKIVEYHGGRIWLDPEYAGGARFRFTLPIPEETT